MNPILLLFLLGGLTTLVESSAGPTSQDGDPPNIILILTDDQGYGDLACHGHPFVRTPNLDALHAASTRLTDFHVSPTCSPTRSALMSGRLPFKNGVTHTILERERMTLACTTVAESLKGAGYATGIFGKWHLGDEEPYQPGNRGFDEVFIHGGGGIGQKYPGSCADAPPNTKNRYFDPVIRHNGVFEKTQGFCTDVFFRQALGWIGENRERPFFAYISTNAPHGPFIAPDSFREPYDELAENKDAASFYGMVTNIDENVGRLVDRLDAWGLTENTLLIFMTDNGSAARSFNAGMKGRKGSVDEGGTRIPAFFRWPGQLEAGRNVERLTRHVDLFPTLAEIAGADVPPGLDGRSLWPLLLDPEAEWSDRFTFFHRGRWGKPGMEGNWGGEGPDSGKYRGFAVRNERWRLVGMDALYDVQADPGQEENVIRENPLVAREMSAAFEAWWSEVRPMLVNEEVPLAEEHPFHVEFARQKDDHGIPVWVPPELDPRPNIIFLLTDDQRDGTFGAMGHPWIQTPNVDRLLGQSVRFRNTYIAEPVCSPSRISLLTGMHERVHGVGFTSSYELTEAQWERTYPALMRKAGYHTGFIGKFGVEYYAFRGKAEEKFDFWWAHDGWTKFFPKDFKGPSCAPYHRAEEDIITSIMGEAIGVFLDQAPEEKPFCLSVSFNVPHGSQTTSMYPDFPGWNRMTLPANENPKLKGNPLYDELYRDLEIPIPDEVGTDPYQFIPEFIMNQDKGRRNGVYPYSYTRPTSLEHHVRYAQTITGLDQVVGDLLDDLEERGLAEDTIIVFASDHGLLMGEHGMGGKSLLYDLASKIPCFIYDPNLPRDLRGRKVDELVSSLDITRTLLDYAGIPELDFMSGASLRPLVVGEDVDWRHDLFLESLYTGRDTPFQEGVRSGKWKYIRMYDGKNRYAEVDVDFANRAPGFEMLFDLEDDPGERINLADNPPDPEVLADLRARCAAGSQELNRRRQAFKGTVEVKKR